jgi:hypothetical protein
MKDLQDNLAQTQARANLLTAVLSDNIAEFERFRASVAQQLSALAEVRTKIGELERALESSRSAYDAVIRSTSWKITSPLRRVSVMLRGKIKSRQRSE